MSFFTLLIARWYDLGPSGDGLPIPEGCGVWRGASPSLLPPPQCFLPSILAGQLRKEGSKLASRGSLEPPKEGDRVMIWFQLGANQ